MQKHLHIYESVTLQNATDTITFSCPAKADSNVWILELDEVHERFGDAFSYEISLNDTPIYIRTMEPLSEGMVPCLVRLDLNAGDTITIRNNSSVPVTFSDIWMHNDLNTLVETYQAPMEIGFCFPRLTYTDRAADYALICKLRDSFADLNHFTLAIGVEVKFMLKNEAQLAEQFNYVLPLARQAGVNIFFNFNSWWDGTPNGRDGKGGYFNDIEYHQVVYDPLSGQKKLSIPNIWRNTPWYSMNHDHLNMVRKARLATTLDILGDCFSRLSLSLGTLPEVRILIDNEPTYWAEFAYSSSPESGGDFNEHTIAAAAKDGVDLNPKGDLTVEQKLWLHFNHRTYMDDVSKTYHTHATKEYATVAGDHVCYGDHHLTENVFTHSMTYAGFPYAVTQYPRYENQMNPWTRLGVETHGHQDERALSNMNRTGRFAQVNAERCCYTDPIFHHQFYAHGAVSDVIFNPFYDLDIKHLHELDDLDQVLMPDPEYGTPIMSYRTYDQKLMGGTIVDRKHIEVAPMRERRVLRPAALGKGSITFSIGTAKDYPYGGWVELTGMVRPANGGITVELGTKPDSFRYTHTMPERTSDYQEIPYRILLKELLAECKDTDTLYMRLNFEMRFYDDWAQMSSIWEIRSVAAFCHSHLNETTPFTLPEHRALALMMSYRSDCKRLKEQYDFLDQSSEISDYKKTYQDMMHRISVANTDKFLICGSGYLEKYKLHVDSKNAVIKMTLESADNGIKATLSGEADATLSVSMEGYDLQSVKLDTNCYLLTASNLYLANEIADIPIDANPNLTNVAVLTIEKEEPVTHTFTGTYVGYDKSANQIEVTTHDLKAYAWQPTLHFTCTEDVPVSIVPSVITGDMLDHISTNPYTPAAILNARIPGEPDIHSLNRGDAISLTLSGDVVTDIHAVRGLARGKIVDIVPLSLSAPMHNAFITIETAPDTLVTFELGTGTHLNYVRAHGENPLLAGDLDLELQKNNIVLVSFEAEKPEKGCYRALEITLV